MQEFFVKRFADQAYLKARLDSRKLVQLKDLGPSCFPPSRLSRSARPDQANTHLYFHLPAQAVSTTPEFTFLEGLSHLLPALVQSTLAAQPASVASSPPPPLPPITCVPFPQTSRPSPFRSLPPSSPVLKRRRPTPSLPPKPNSTSSARPTSRIWPTRRRTGGRER